MAQCKARIFSDDTAVNADMFHHISTGKRVEEVLQCVWPEGHEKGGTRAPTHHSSGSATWDGPAVDQTIPSEEEKQARIVELQAELAQLAGKKG